MDNVPDRARDSHTTRKKYERYFVYDVETTSSKTSSRPRERSPRTSSGDERNTPRSSTKAATSQKSPAANKKSTPKRKQSPETALKQDTPKTGESSKDSSKKKELNYQLVPELIQQKMRENWLATKSQKFKKGKRQDTLKEIYSQKGMISKIMRRKKVSFPKRIRNVHDHHQS